VVRYFVGTEHHINADKISQIIEGEGNLKGNYLNLKLDYNDGVFNLHRLKKLFGGYTY